MVESKEVVEAPDDYEPLFSSKVGESERVHVINQDRQPTPMLGGDEITIAEALIRQIVGVSYCGLKCDGYKGYATAYAFEDERLCVRCAEHFPYDRVLLFQHPTDE